MPSKIHIATSRGIGEFCIDWAKSNGYIISSMDDCDIFISILYDKLISEDYIKTRPCFNFHPGILPNYRGAGAFSWAILNQEIETGITLHKIDKDIDNGEVIDIQRFFITSEDTAESLFDNACSLLFKMFKEWLPKLITGDYKSFAQDNGRLYSRDALREAKNLTRFARAFHFEGKEQAYYFNKAGRKIYLKYD